MDQHPVVTAAAAVHIWPSMRLGLWLANTPFLPTHELHG